MTQAKYACDICGFEALGYNKDTREIDWTGLKNFEVGETSVTMKTGSSYPGTGHGEHTTLHICPDCFKEELVPFMLARSKVGASTPTITEWDY